jgi:hypothetical protein
MKIGFTGTQAGMSVPQQDMFLYLMYQFTPQEFHHGDCIGADAEAHDIVTEQCPGTKIIVHPPNNSSKRAFKRGDDIRVPLEYIQRNRYIVVESDIVIAAPRELKEVLRSGTWSTIRFAKTIKKPLYIIMRDGSVEPHNV